jgi:hypothetical protein
MREDQACRDKIPHPNRASAVAHKYRLIATTGAHGCRFSVYRCQFCDKYHVGKSKPPRKRKRW